MLSKTIPTSDSPPLIKLPEVLMIFSISRSAWLAGVKAGRFPQPVHLSDRIVRWKKADIDSYLAAL